MIYRIDFQNFLVHAIDHFSLVDITNMQYAIISAKVGNMGKCANVVKFNDLYPDTDTVIAYSEHADKDILEKMYLDMLNPPKEERKGSYSNMYDNIIYKAFINPLLSHYNVVIICDREENDYIDILCKHLKKHFGIEVIDLNELFTKGRVGPIYIDRSEITDRAVDIRRACVREEYRSMSSTRDGKEALISKMTKKEKLKHLKKFGVRVSKNDEKDLDKLLLDAWCAEDEDENSD